MTAELTKEIEKDLGVKLSPASRLANEAVGKMALASGTVTAATTRQHIDDVIAELQMTIRILEEAKKRL